MSTTTAGMPPLQLDHCTVEEVRERFEALSNLASPEMRDWARGMARSHARHYQEVFRRVHTARARGNVNRVVDIGAVPGFITVTLKQSGLDVKAIDLAPERTGEIFSSGDVPCHRVDIEREQLPFEDNSVELALFNEVLEHLRINPILALREIQRILRPQGTLLLSTPNITMPMRVRFLLGRDYQDDVVAEFRKLETVGHMGHFRLYSRGEVHRLLQHLGFTVIDSHAVNTQMNRPSWKRRLLTSLMPEAMGDHLYVTAAKNA